MSWTPISEWLINAPKKTPGRTKTFLNQWSGLAIFIRSNFCTAITLLSRPFIFSPALPTVAHDSVSGILMFVARVVETNCWPIAFDAFQFSKLDLNYTTKNIFYVKAEIISNWCLLSVHWCGNFRWLWYGMNVLIFHIFKMAILKKTDAEKLKWAEKI